MTQTTAGRITEIIREHLKFYAGSGEWAAAVEAGQEIAAEIDALTRERDQARALIPVSRVDLGAHDKTISALAVERDALKAEAERLRPAAEAWRQVFELQAKYSTHWRLNDETYWLARFMEEVGELAGALVGNHVGPVEWELSQIAAIALNWLDMRADRARAAKEAKP